MKNNDYIKSISAFEQAGANLANFAAMLSVYNKNLIEAGFQRDESIILVKELQTIIFSQSFNLGTKPEEEPE